MSGVYLTGDVSIPSTWRLFDATFGQEIGSVTVVKLIGEVGAHPRVRYKVSGRGTVYEADLVPGPGVRAKKSRSPRAHLTDEHLEGRLPVEVVDSNTPVSPFIGHVVGYRFLHGADDVEIKVQQSVSPLYQPFLWVGHSRHVRPLHRKSQDEKVTCVECKDTGIYTCPIKGEQDCSQGCKRP